MFCVLNVKERDNNLFEKLFGCFVKDEYSVQTVPVFKGAPFYVLDVSVGRKGINWENVVMAVGKCSSRLITKYRIDFPDIMNIGLFESKILYDKMMKNTFLNILDRNNTKNKPLSISFFDENAEYTEYTKQLSEYASALSVTTHYKEKYYGACEEITENIGLCPVLKSDFDDATVKINGKENTMTVKGDSENLNISSGLDFTVPQIYENLLPSTVEKYNFYSALYELCGVFSLGDCFFDTIIVNNEKKSVSDIHFS